MTTQRNEIDESATIYEDRDNPFTIVLSKNGAVLTELEMQAITKWEIRYDDVYYNSDDYPSAFVANETESSLEIFPYAFGLESSVKLGEVVEFIIYDAVNFTNGLVWDQFVLIVKADANVPPTS